MVVMANPKQNKKSFNKSKPPKFTRIDSDEELEELAETQNVPKDVLVIAQEVKIVKSLACNDLKKRNRQMRKLRKWLELRSKSTFSFSDEDFMRIWKGLYYNMWMSDKPLVQEELAEQLAKLLECFDDDLELSVRFFAAFVRTMCQEWFGIDQWRIDKFLMLARRMLRYMFKVLKGGQWAKESIQLFNEYMLKTVLSSEKLSAVGLTMHYMDIFFEELAKVSEGDINGDQVGEFVRPFVTFMATQNNGKLVSHCRSRVFYHLLYQSTLGREYSEKYNAWKEMGFPTASIDDLEKEDSESLMGDDDDEDGKEQQQQQLLDPRAGNVDVFMPELPLDGKYIVEDLEMYIFKRDCNAKCRKMLKKLLATFQTYRNGEFPLGIRTMPRFVSKAERPLIKDKVEKLENMENEMFGIGRKLKQLNKRKRRKFLKSLNFDDVDDGSIDQLIESSLPKQYLERKNRARNAMMNGWLEEELDVETSAQQSSESSEDKETEAVKPQQAKQKKPKQNDKLPLIQIAGQRPKLKKNAATESLKEEEPAKKLKKIEADFKKMEVKEVEIEPSKPSAESQKKAKATEEQQSKKDTPSTTPTSNNKKNNKLQLSTSLSSEWENAPADGEIEYFIPSRKLQMKKANSELVLNPVAARKNAELSQSTPKTNKSALKGHSGTPKTPGSVKRIKIALKNNTAQTPSEYIKQLKSSPNVPYDASKKPGKGLLKPNSMPSPINPFYKKKIGLRLLNDTL